MSSLTHFNLDIVIVMILVFFIAYSYYRGLFRSIRLFFQLLIAILGIEIINRSLISSNTFDLFNNKIISFLSKLERIVYIPNKNIMSLFIVYLLIFIVSFIIIYIIFAFFAPSATENIIKKHTKLERIFSIIIGLASSYIVLVIFVLFGSLILPFQNRGVSKLLITKTPKITTIEKYNKVNYALPEVYAQYNHLINLANGQTLMSEFNKIAEISAQLKVSEDIFANVILKRLHSQDARDILEAHLPTDINNYLGYGYALLSSEDGKLVYDTIIEKEKVNAEFNIIYSQYDFFIANEDYIRLIYRLDEAELSIESFAKSVANLENFDELLELTTLNQAYKFYYYLSESILTAANLDVNLKNDLLSYHLAIEEIITNNDELALFVENYLTKQNTLNISDQETKVLYNEFLKMLKTLNKSWSKFENYDLRLSLATRLALNNLNISSIAEDLLNNPLVITRINDEINTHQNTVSNFDGSTLYIEGDKKLTYLFSELVIIAVIDKFTVDDPINQENIELALRRLHEMIANERKFSNEFVATLLEIFVIDYGSHSLLAQLHQHKLITDDAIKELHRSEFSFVSSVTKEYLFEYYL